MFTRSCALVAVSVGIGCACQCVEPSVQFKKDRSDVVFRGTVLELRDSDGAGFSLAGVRKTKRIVLFHVIRVWKGEIGHTFEMVDVGQTDACMGFWPAHLTIGSDLLVYASRRDSDYVTGTCGLHKPGKDAKDYEALGPGEEPQKDKDQKPK